MSNSLGNKIVEKSSNILNVQESWVFYCVAALELQEVHAKYKRAISI